MMNNLNVNDIRIDGVDQRIGMGIGGWDVIWTATHIPTGCAVTWRITGSHPQSQHMMRDRALMALELMTEVYHE
jgi:protein subunit release factor A